MAYNKYTINNLAQGTVGSTLTSGSTTLILSSGQGALFPTTFPFILKLEGFTDGNVVRREIVKCIGRSSDTLTIVRSFENCPANYTAVIQTNIVFQFEVGDVVSLVITKETMLDIQTEVTRIEADKLNKNGALRTGLGNYKVIYTSATGVETELPLGANGTFLKSNGATSLPTFDLPTVASASETVEGVVERATDAEAIAGTDTTRYITPKQARDNSIPISYLSIVGGTNFTYASALVERNTTSTTYTKVKEITINDTGIYTVSFQMKRGASGTNSYAKIYKNGVALGTEQIQSNETYTYKTENLSFSATDKLQLYIKSDFGTTTTFVQNLTVKYTRVIQTVIIPAGTVNID